MWLLSQYVPGLREGSLPAHEREQAMARIRSLEPWYQPIEIGAGLRTVARDKGGNRITSWSLDRGIRKWFKFIKPNLPFSLADKVVLDCGCNAGAFLLEACREGARAAYGIELSDHYYAQARFVIETAGKARGAPYPIQVFQSPFEAFDFEGLNARSGPIDLTFFLNTIYHIGKPELTGNNEWVCDEQVQMVKRVGAVSRFILFQANPLEDQGRGKGRGSLLEIIHRAGLSVVHERSYPHPRGLIVVASR